LLVALLRYSNLVLRTFGLTGPFGGPMRNDRLRRLRYRAIDRVAPLIPGLLSRPFERRLVGKIDELAEGRFSRSNRITAELTGLNLPGFGYDVETLNSGVP
jgi:hypothetical protein